MKQRLIFAIALSLCLSHGVLRAETAATETPAPAPKKAAAKKAPKKALKKVPPSEPVASPEPVVTPETSPTPTPTTSTEAVPMTPAPAQNETTTTTTTESTAAATTETETPAASGDGYGKTEGLLGKFLFGPNLTVLGFPTPFRLGLETKWDNLLGLTFDYGLFPSLTISDVKLKYNSWRLAARVFPFRGAFYLGLGYGKQSFTGATSKDVGGQVVDYNLVVDTTILVPQIGWRWTSESGFFFGMELGVQLASSSTPTFTSSVDLTGNADYEANKADILDAGKTFGQTTLPHMALVQLGWFL